MILWKLEFALHIPPYAFIFLLIGKKLASLTTFAISAPEYISDF